ncbi:hypothetical protein L6164_018432 [Bauhinia variegata]|uniref:Uncharacterized protein n=1 Tax=Bauhinia variegata TaxID=167791 RepID=A0ACB9NBX3_BAUVA|nr:hypothetical protein L6164_018432 [Bauhinia variegata]
MAKRFPFLISISKHPQSTTPKFSVTNQGSGVFFSTAPHQHVQGDDAIEGATNNPDSAVRFTGADDRANPVINLEEGNTKNDEDHEKGVTGFVADAAKQGTENTTEVVENIADKVKETVDTAWDATKDTAQNIRDRTTAEADTNVVDTAEYRSHEDLKGELGDGHDNRMET